MNLNLFSNPQTRKDYESRQHTKNLCVITWAFVGMALLVPGAFTLRLLARIDSQHPLPQCQRHENLTYQECMDQLMFRAMAFTYSGVGILMLIGLAKLISFIRNHCGNTHSENDVALNDVENGNYGTMNI